MDRALDGHGSDARNQRTAPAREGGIITVAQHLVSKFYAGHEKAAAPISPHRDGPNLGVGVADGRLPNVAPETVARADLGIIHIATDEDGFDDGRFPGNGIHKSLDGDGRTGIAGERTANFHRAEVLPGEDSAHRVEVRRDAAE